ncbi:hypothetical protein GO986_11350 [Deinococcus sp. HMF7620]|uniref:Lipoprotein n=1 Tax=Deinococcus arboris TaxID=2682977 RepID=A0A7C9MRM4_9DEIO|nr:hypothetical protein [Deinococcus arboris]MVN87364.1 hypothetical protein [Deinococcus arboris]
MTKRMLLTGLTALLAACAPAPLPAAPTPAAPHPAGLYELQLRVTDQGVGQASLRHVDPGGLLSGQALTAAGDPVQLGAQAITTQTFTTRKNGADIRHISTTFAATNVTASALQNLTLLPVVLTDTDGDPENNATAPTVVGTPFRSVRLFDGSDASGQAASIRPVQGQQVNVQTGESTDNLAATLFLSGLNVASLGATPPAGLSMTVQNQGWLAAETLAPGATVPVTFAVDLPIDRSNTRGQAFSFSLMFTAAQDVTGSEVGLPADPAVVRGTLQGWTRGAGYELSEEYMAESGWVRRRTVPVAAIGSVDLSLQGQETSQLFPFLDADCPVQGEQSAPNLHVAWPYLAVYSAQGDRLGQVREVDTTNKPVRRLYADAPLRVKGTAPCQSLPEISFEYDLTLQPGWNLITETQRRVGENFIIRYQSLPSGARTRLRFVQSGPWVRVGSPEFGSELNLRAGQPLAVPFQLFQDGGVSGPVTVTSSLPGVSVTPDTLNLPALTGQTLGVQAVTTSLTLTADARLAGFSDPLTLTFFQNGQVVGRVSYLLTVTP